MSYNFKTTPTVFDRMIAQINAFLEKEGCYPTEIFMSRELANEFKISCRDYGHHMKISVDRDDTNDMAKFNGISVRRVIDCAPSYLHVIGKSK